MVSFFKVEPKPRKTVLYKENNFSNYVTIFTSNWQKLQKNFKQHLMLQLTELGGVTLGSAMGMMMAIFTLERSSLISSTASILIHIKI